MKRTAIFPGSFDPFTVGHESIVRRGMPIFDKIIIAIGNNSAKKGFFSIEKRKSWIENVFADDSKVSVEIFTGLTIDFCKNRGAQFILRGLRTASDFEYERAIGQMNRAIYSKIETVFLLTEPEHTMISSTIVRELVRYKGDVSKFVPAGMNLYE